MSQVENIMLWKKLLCLLPLVVSVVGCGPDYGIVAEVRTEYVEVEVPVEKSGEVWVDSFDQPQSVEGVDILWVIDTSGSMTQWRAALMAGIEEMLLALPTTDWRLNMISNSPDVVINEQQFPLLPGDDIVDAEDMYNYMTIGHREAGFDATYEYIVNNPYSSTWMREDAALLVVMVSDEEEQSSDFSKVDDFVYWYSLMRSSVFLSNITHSDPSVSDCNWSISNNGDRYREATDKLGGVTVDICDDDWAPGVRDASQQVHPHEEWVLSHLPQEDSIKVFINGNVNNDWTYDIYTNTVHFTVVPAGGDHVDIGYLIEKMYVIDTAFYDSKL